MRAVEINSAHVVNKHFTHSRRIGTGPIEIIRVVEALLPEFKGTFSGPTGADIISAPLETDTLADDDWRLENLESRCCVYS